MLQSLEDQDKNASRSPGRPPWRKPAWSS